jgi:methylthioribose-1-phosphate isomerase
VTVRAFRLEPDGLFILDQRALPHEETWLQSTSVEDVAVAIETLAVRGAPAIGGAAALGMVIAARTGVDPQTADARLRRTRPTAVNLFAALDHMRLTHGAGASDVEARARGWVDADEQMCAQLGAHGAELFVDGDVVITICHTGALATCGQGTALGCIKSAIAQGKEVRVVALETRPLLQGARLTAWECGREGIPCTLITDGMSAFAIKKLGVTKAIVGADRIARDGSTANKIGTYTLATVCTSHAVPFFVAAPSTTIDPQIGKGRDIPIEQRAADEVRTARGTPLAPADVRVWNPAFDVTPPGLIDAIVTERGVHRGPYDFSPAPEGA